MKGSFYENLVCVFDKIPTYHKKMLLGDFNAEVDRKDIFQPTTSESLHESVMIMEIE
jgi:hypothetical protein